MAHITVEGRLGADVELAFGQSGKARASFPLAEQHRKKDPSGQWVDDSTSWYRVTLWGKSAENAAEAFRKGQPVMVTGDLKVVEFETRDGGKGRAAEINARAVGAIAVGGVSAGQRDSGQPGGGSAGDPWATGGAESPF